MSMVVMALVLSACTTTSDTTATTPSTAPPDSVTTTVTAVKVIGLIEDVVAVVCYRCPISTWSPPQPMTAMRMTSTVVMYLMMKTSTAPCMSNNNKDINDLGGSSLQAM